MLSLVYFLLFLFRWVECFHHERLWSERNARILVERRPRRFHKQVKGIYNEGNGATSEKNAGGSMDTNMFLPIVLKLASQHFASQALYAALRLQLPDIIGEKQLSLDEIAGRLGDKTNKDALRRTLRLLTAVQVVEEMVLPGSKEEQFSLTSLGKCFQRASGANIGMASCILHWMEQPLWNAWLELPQYIMGEGGPCGTNSPFAMANGGISSDFWYNERDQPESLSHANDFVRYIHNQEVAAVVNGLDWTVFRKNVVVDIGGHFGILAAAIAEKGDLPDVICLDLPNVISKAPKRSNVNLVAGDVFDAATIPSCDVIVMKHFLDKCMWNDEETIQILKNCHGALSQTGTLVIAEAVLPSYGDVSDENAMPLYMDALYMLVGREGQRTQAEWEILAYQTSFEVKDMKKTHMPSCSLVVLQKV
ncbi:methylase [Nitzschia inconspicua]|uniref:Methylase n=1 Tax=Nitzschia inconspicua TaxID=303405 RepID=A0A9K3KRT5_9STRA|nr:methylase [Nitzschia inconspicua]